MEKFVVKSWFIFVGTILLSILANFSLGDQAIENYTYTIPHSSRNFTFWTTLPTEKVFKDSPVPSQTGKVINVLAAKNEFEPFVLVVKPSFSGSVQVSVGDFGAGIEVEIYQVKYVELEQSTDFLGRQGQYPDPLWPLENGDSVTVNAGENTAFWFNVKVPDSASAGDYSAQLNISGVNIPIILHVFNFRIPDELHVKSGISVNFNSILSNYSVPGYSTEYWAFVDKAKQFLIDHRLTPQAVAWPGGLTTSGGAPLISYDCAGNFEDNYGIWGFEAPAARYLDGTELSPYLDDSFNNGTGFPSFMIDGISNNNASYDQRPSEFCGITRSASDWYTANNPDSPYNQKWFEYISALQNYLSSLGYLDNAYFRIAAELYSASDYDAIALYSHELKSVASQLKLMAGSSPDSRIYDNPLYQNAKIDIWLSDLMDFDPAVSSDRDAFHDEETWLYWDRADAPPFFNPFVLDHPGVEYKYTGWFLWKYKVRGLTHIGYNNWIQNPWTNPMSDGVNGLPALQYPPSQIGDNIPYGSNNHRFVSSIRLELLRDSLEDFEYLYILNDFAVPQAGISNDSDELADLIIGGLNYYNRDSSYIYNLRKCVGMKIGQEIAAIPTLVPTSDHPRADGEPCNYYINFQDPAGQPLADPLIQGGSEYIKAGWEYYDAGKGYGWYGDNSMGRYAYTTGEDELQKSVIYDDYGRINVFEFDLPNGLYNVTVSVGWTGRRYLHQKVEIEGQSFINDEAPSEGQSFIVRTKEVEIKDKKLSMSIGLKDEYTMLNYLVIELPETCDPWDFDCDGKTSMKDAALLAGSWSNVSEDPDWNPDYDLLADEIIDIEDLSIFVQHWLEGCAVESAGTLN